MKFSALALLMALLSLSAAWSADVITVTNGAVTVNGGMAVSGQASATNVLVGRATPAVGQEVVRGDDPRMSDARPANGGNAATVGGKGAALFVEKTSLGVANGVATLDATGKLPAAQIPSAGIGAKAWVVFDPSGVILGGYGVSSVTHNGTGDYTLRFTAAMANTNYAVVGNTSCGSWGVSTVQVLADGVNKTTASIRVLTYVYGNFSDGTTNIVVFGP